MGAAAVVGAVEGVRTKSLMGGLKGALGAYGGAGLTTSLASFGAEGLGQQALPQLTELGTPTLAPTITPDVASSLTSADTSALDTLASQQGVFQEGASWVWFSCCTTYYRSRSGD
jgi:hypothetical protein